MRKKISIAFLSTILILCGGAGAVLASETTGEINVGIQTGMEGVIKAAPTASPAAGTYTSTQSVSLTASGSTAICYTTNSTTPACSGTTACSTGTKYSSAISIASTATVKSVACYADSTEGPAGSDAYTISTATITPSGGGGGYVADTTAPAISNVVAKPTTGNTANITWTTNESSLSWVVYGTTTAYGQELKTTSYTASHSVNLTGLTPNTTYYYQVKSQDSSNNTAASAAGTFTTLGQGESANVDEPTTSTQTPVITSTTPLPVPSKPLAEMNRTELITFLIQLIAAIQSGATVSSSGGATGSIDGIPSGFTFQNSLRFGMSSVDVKYLQIFLNTDADTKVSLSGAGSPGNETMMFGNATLAAVKKFQVKHGVADASNPGYGLVGPATRAKLNSLLGK